MDSVHDIAKLLVSCWVLGEEGGDTKIPSSHGVLDRALQIAAGSKEFPEWARKKLHFVDSRIGLQCVELPSILEWAQRAEFTSAPNPSYQYTQITVGPRVAKHLLRDLQISEDEAKSWGKSFRAAVTKAQRIQESFANATIEEY